METRFTDQTGITIGAEQVYSTSAKCNVTRWSHYDNNDAGRARRVGPWYASKEELLLDHEDYLKRAGWLRDTDTPVVSLPGLEPLGDSTLDLDKRLEVANAAMAHANAVVAVRLCLQRGESRARLAELQKNAHAAFLVLNAAIGQLVASEVQ